MRSPSSWALGLALGALGLLLLAAGPDPAPPADPAATPAVEPSAPAGPGFTLGDWPLDEAATRGRAVYARRCIGCHGETGLGDGAVADLLDPRPRNFQAGNFKFRTTPSGELPTLDDVKHVVRCGLNGSAMRSFTLLPERELDDVARYVLALAEFGVVKRDVEYELDGEPFSGMAPEAYAELRDEALAVAHEADWPVPVTPAPPFDQASIDRGRQLYEAQCVACHGAGGMGDGVSSFHLRDGTDALILPRDFTTGIFRAGSTPRDVFLRLRTGLNGTPMPSISGSDEDLWHIVHFILSLQSKDRIARPHPASCDAHAAPTARGERP